jgi:hypothetical protein
MSEAWEPCKIDTSLPPPQQSLFLLPWLSPYTSASAILPYLSLTYQIRVNTVDLHLGGPLKPVFCILFRNVGCHDCTVSKRSRASDTVQKGKVVPVLNCVRKTFGGVGLELHHSRWMWVIASCPGRFTSGERTSGTHWIGGLYGPRAGLGAVEKRTGCSLH